MRSTRWIKKLVGVAVLFGIGVLLLWAFWEGHEELERERERERPVHVPARVSMANGETVVLLDEATQARSGIATASLERIPDSAVVWWQGKSWVYVYQRPERFIRKEVSGRPLIPGEQIVVRGAQQILSEELRAQIQMEGEEGKKE